MLSLHFGELLERLRQIDFDVGQNLSKYRRIGVAAKEIVRDWTERERECPP
jgi:hypothetical protein